MLVKMATCGRRRRVSGLRERASLNSTDCYIVREIYNGENAQEQFEYELEQALETQYKYIIIEPTRIGDETARWIAVGNCLHKTSVIAGSVCLLTPIALASEYARYVTLPIGAISVACAALYGISWQFDPCCKYQVEYDTCKLSQLPLNTLTSSTPVVLRYSCCVMESLCEVLLLDLLMYFVVAVILQLRLTNKAEVGYKGSNPNISATQWPVPKLKNHQNNMDGTIVDACEHH
ncbi:transmembrane protein 11, mitochondrial isoform X1 [Narcine bancroftii]|uniref:transmembrane protein 11, mitochondrial isoform X1 n=1 Tax=Narcine bancroftii TaxID=1343680 RepID=UPI00383171E7